MFHVSVYIEDVFRQIFLEKGDGNEAEIKINKKSGKVTVRKGLKKGTYKVKVKVKVKGSANYKPSAWKTVTFKVRVK